MKRYIKASTGSSILTSSNGNFSLVKESGVGMNDTPWTGYKVKGSKLADKHVVHINIEQSWEDFNGEPVEYTPIGCYIGYGMRSVKDTTSDIRQFVSLLEEALDFKEKLDEYFSQRYDKYRTEE